MTLPATHRLQLAEFELKAHHFSGVQPGPRLIILGAVHGNEICGSIAIQQMLSALNARDLVIRKGHLTLVPVTNPLAWHQRTREGQRNLNRKLQPTDHPVEFEDHIANWLCPLLASHDVLLDLHSFHTPGEPFVMLGPEDNDGELEPFAHSRQEHAFARHLGIERFVDGWLDTYARGVERRKATDAGGDPSYGVGTTEYMRTQGGYGVTVECGQHDDPAAIAVARHCILNTLAFLSMIDEPMPREVSKLQHLRMVDVVDLADDEDTFSRDWNSFDAVLEGEAIGHRADGTPVVASRDGFILFPNPTAAVGREWFYLAESINRSA